MRSLTVDFVRNLLFIQFDLVALIHLFVIQENLPTCLCKCIQVARLQEQLQAERDLRAALEVGLSMSSGQFSSSRGMDSKVHNGFNIMVHLFLFYD